MIALLIFIVVVAIIAGLVLWLISLLPLQAPWGQVARVGVIIIAVLVILSRLLPLAGVHSLS